MDVYPLKSRLLQPGDSLRDEIGLSLRAAKLTPRNGDVIAVSSKVVAVTEGNLRSLTGVHPSKEAVASARRYRMRPDFVQVVHEEAHKYYSGVTGAILTLKDGDAVANAGVDQKNSPAGSVVLWPRDPDMSSRLLRKRLQRLYKKRLGVVIVDSRVTPLRLGTIGLALSCSGFSPVEDQRGRQDLYGRPARITSHAIADGIACAAHLVMGELAEKTPFALVRNLPFQLDGRNHPKSEMLLPASDCLFMSNIDP